MKYLIFKDKRRRILFSFFERRKLFLKALIKDMRLPETFRIFVYKQLLELPRDASITRIRNRCILTNRPRGIYKKFGLSRLMFRKYVWKGKLIGVKNSSW
jgi:ribosomal protein S14